MRILVVEDDELVAHALAKILTDQNYAVEIAQDGQAGWELIEAYEYDLVLLDVMLPQLDGISLCKKARSHNHQMPILLVTGRDSGHDKAVGLDAGADDYVVKPFDAEELVARVRALLRRSGTTAQPVLEWGNLRLDPTTCEVTWQFQPLSLTSKEYALLELFLRNSRRVFSCGMILEHLWSYETMPGEEAVRTHIKCLRQKFKAASIPTDLIETVYGIGYRLKPLQEREQGSVRSQESGVRSREPGGKRQVDREMPKPENGRDIKPQSPSSSLRPAAHAPMSSHLTLTAIAGVWERFKGRIGDQVAVLERWVVALETQAIAPDLLQHAEREAHTLAGALGTFGFHNGSQIAREIENLLKLESDLQRAELERLRTLVTTLRQEISHSPVSKASPIPSKPPLLLVIDRDRPLMHDICTEANHWGLRTATAKDLVAAQNQIYRDRPTVVLLDPYFSGHINDGLTLLSNLHQAQPPIPALIFTAQDGLAERLQVVQLGGRTFLHKPTPILQVLEAVNQVLQQSDIAEARVLAVDDDPQTLEVLTTLLQPWGLQVSTLSDPRRFWETLEVTSPDLLILDVTMPYVNGIDLCQIVRNDSHWGGLPILFLAAHTDANVVNQVFAAGADDFVSKPIIGPELVTRIINRLDRIKLLRNLAETDSLTGLTNRQKSTQSLEKFLNLAKRQEQPLCLVVLDLDHFKQINDRYGHATGDDVLRQIGHLLHRAFRSEDVVARWGGEEFVVGMYGTIRADGVHRLTTLLKTLRQQDFIAPDGSKFRVTFSAGVAQYPLDGRDLQSLYKAADAVMYQAKTAGRDRVLPATPSRELSQC